MLRPLASPDVAGTDWLDPFVSDFRTRFATLLAGAPPALACASVNDT
jgi:N-acetyltransferase 10